MIAALLLVLVLALALSVTLAHLQKRLKLASPHKGPDLLPLLPGIDCGLCGYAGCAGYAAALADGQDRDLLRCPPGGSALPAQLALSLQLPNPAAGPAHEVAVVKCLGGDGQVRKAHHYHGPQDCHAEFLLLDGEKSCRYSCLGKGSCLPVCPTQAIHINAQRLAIINPADCIGCKLCVDACPTGVIAMVPADQPYYVGCNSVEHGKTVRDKCRVGCIGCRICERKHGSLAFGVRENLASVRWQGQAVEEQEIDQAIADCPTGCISRLPDGNRKTAATLFSVRKSRHAETVKD